jgi:hypothetical protein
MRSELFSRDDLLMEALQREIAEFRRLRERALTPGPSPASGRGVKGEETRTYTDWHGRTRTPGHSGCSRV